MKYTLYHHLNERLLTNYISQTSKQPINPDCRSSKRDPPSHNKTTQEPQLFLNFSPTRERESTCRVLQQAVACEGAAKGEALASKRQERKDKAKLNFNQRYLYHICTTLLMYFVHQLFTIASQLFKRCSAFLKSAERKYKSPK